ncbi:MAG: hypothetical protein UR98_C0018G0003 [Parcubacteria group bacterium GW2011_GWA1_36_12]|nr:MAG: hypothetical protein UR98_C0018G0003 [Parcubacteria group bacterium GW2011_GWA1_36_12]
MEKKYIKFSTKYDQKLVNSIMYLLKNAKLDSYTMLEFSKALGKQYKEGSLGWQKLRLHLIYLVMNGEIEERHFGKKAGDWNRIVDYV